MSDQVTSGLWSEGEELLSIYHRELLAVERGLHTLQGRFEGTCGGSVFRQHHSCGISQARKGHALSHAQRVGTANSSLGGAGGDLPPSTI